MLPGGTGTLLLSDLGADVLKVERPGDLDATRFLQPRIGEESSAQHQYLDRGKRTVELDLRADAGREELLGHVAEADAVIDSFRPGVMERLGLSPETLLGVNPRLVVVCLSGYGQEGPMASYAGHDLNFVGRAGLLGPGTEAPTVQVADLGGGILAALAITAGVVQARATGRGSVVDLALADAALVMGGMSVAAELGAKRLGRPAVNPLDGRSPCYAVYEAADGGRLTVGALEPKFWRNVVELLGQPAWFERQFDPTLQSELRDLFATKPLVHWVDLLEGPDTCVAAVSSMTDLPADAHLSLRGALVDHPTSDGIVEQIASPFHHRTPGEPVAPSKEKS
jgi:alpha-methylacyl-CoA racemase